MVELDSDVMSTLIEPVCTRSLQLPWKHAESLHVCIYSKVEFTSIAIYCNMNQVCSYFLTLHMRMHMLHHDNMSQVSKLEIQSSNDRFPTQRPFEVSDSNATQQNRMNW